MKVAALVVGLAVCAVQPLAAQPAPASIDVAWGPAPSGRPPFLPMLLPDSLRIDIPGRNGQDWHARVGFGNVVLLAVERKKGEAALWVESVTLGSPMTEEIPDEDLLNEAAEDLKRKEPSASDAQHAVVVREGHRFVYSTYIRKGVLPVPERVIQYFFLTPGLSLYRVVCSSDAAVAQRYTPICGHMARSFAATLPAGAAPAPAAPQ